MPRALMWDVMIFGKTELDGKLHWNVHVCFQQMWNVLSVHYKVRAKSAYESSDPSG